MGLLLHKLFLGRWDDVHHWLGEVRLHLGAMHTHASYGVGALVMLRGHSRGLYLLLMSTAVPSNVEPDCFEDLRIVTSMLRVALFLRKLGALGCAFDR